MLRGKPDAVLVLCGGGLSKSTTPGCGGTFKGLPVGRIGTAGTWATDPELVRCWYDEQRMACATVLPNPAHEALARMQHALSARRCTLVTWTIDGLLQKASAEHVVELDGSLFRLRCGRDPDHPRTSVYGPQPRRRKCACGGELRPDVVWPGEPALEGERVDAEVARADVFLAVGASGPRLHEWLDRARTTGAHAIEVNPEPSGAAFDEVLAEPAEQAIPRLVGRWLGEE